MHAKVLKLFCNIVLGINLLASASSSFAAEKNALLPAGWTALPKEKSSKDGLVAIEGFFTSPKVKTKAILVENKTEGKYGLAVTMPTNQTAKIIQTFKDISPNPPSLSVVKAGKYHPTCHPEVTKCDAFMVKNQAIGLAFDESSAQIIYFDKNKFHAVFVTD
jgi:hypothetical protein